MSDVMSLEFDHERNWKEFAVQENRNPQVSKEQWLERYVYTEIHEIFFASFPSELY